MKMLSLVAAATLVTASAFGQANAHVAIKGGLNLSNLVVENYDDRDVRAGVHLGLTAHMHITPQLAVQPELLYSQEGGKLTNIGGNRDQYAKFKNDYINIPVMLQYMFDNGFRLEAGPQLGVLVNSKVEDQDGVEENTNSDFRTTNVSLGVGLNYLTYSGFGLGGRYNFGLSDISEGAGKTRGNNLQISLFYMLDPSHKRRSR